MREPSRSHRTPALAGLALLVAALVPVLASAAAGPPASPSPPVAAAVADPVINVYRFWNVRNNTHFYTANEDERRNVILGLPAIYRYEGVAYTIDTSTGRADQPLYRFFNKKAGTHFFTASADERDKVMRTLSGIFVYEGVAYGVITNPASGDVPVHRFFNLGGTPSHFYTASEEERARVASTLSRFFKYEGIAYWVTSASLPSSRTPVVCIDPGHQAHANLTPEPIGPGSSITKPMVAAGTIGINTRLPEYRFALAVSLKLRDRLEARGVRVVMTRMTDDVDISNAQRALVANVAGADLFIRVHADGSTNTSAHGASTLYPAGNSWVAPITDRSYRAAYLVQSNLIAATGATNRGLVGRSDMTGFNWSVVPAVIVESGFMTNPTEDQYLANDGYQNQLADGMAAGVLAYLGK